MTNKGISHHILGTGYTAQIAYYLLKSNGFNPEIISINNSFWDFSINIRGQNISPIPIFPIKESFLFNLLGKDEFRAEPLDVKFNDSTSYDFSKESFEQDSFAKFLINDKLNNNSLGLSYKQWGPKIFSSPLSEVQNKIIRHYSRKEKATRIGYNNGLSYYHYIIAKNKPNYINLDNKFQIDFSNKQIKTKNNKFNYSKLISAIPLQKLFNYCNLHHAESFQYESANILFFSHQSELKENSMIYDLNINSNIQRIFAANDNIILVQTSNYSFSEFSLEKVTQRIYSLLPQINEIKLERELRIKLSYPIESVKDPKSISNISKLNENNIIPFGRFGRWEYKDLHELDWNSIH